MMQPNHEAVTAPKLNVVTVKQLFGPFVCIGIICANEGTVADEMAIVADDVARYSCTGLTLKAAVRR